MSILSKELVYYILEPTAGLHRVHPLEDHSPRSHLLGKSSPSPSQLRSMAAFKFLQLDRVSKGLLNLFPTQLCRALVLCAPLPHSRFSAQRNRATISAGPLGEKGDSSPPHLRRSGFPIRAGRQHPSGGQPAPSTAATPGRGAGSLPSPGAPHRSNSQSGRLPHCPVTRPPD